MARGLVAAAARDWAARCRGTPRAKGRMWRFFVSRHGWALLEETAANKFRKLWPRSVQRALDVTVPRLLATLLRLQNRRFGANRYLRYQFRGPPSTY